MLKSHMPQCGTFAEDKELEIYLATENIFVDYAEDILVYERRPHAKRSWHGKDPAGSTPNCWHSL